MKSRKSIRNVSLIVILVLCITSLVSCSAKNNNKDTQGNGVNKGRYVEKEVELPELSDDENILQIGRSQTGGLRIYSIDIHDKKADIYQYDQQEDGSFNRSTVEWLHNLNMEDYDEEQSQFIFQSEGAQYAYFNMRQDGIWRNHIFKTEDGKEREEVVVKEWEKNKKSQNSVTIGVTDKGNILLQNATDLCQYDSKKETFQSILDIQKYSRNDMIVGGNKVVLFSGSDPDSEINSYVIFDADNLDTNPQQLDTDQTYDVYGFVNENNDIITVDNQGIHQLVNGTSALQLIVDGTMNTMYAASSYPKQIIKGNNECFYVLYYVIENDEYEIMQYSYDSNINATPDKTLTVYSLYYDLWAKEAAVVFQREHPDVKVELRVAMDDDSAATVDDYIRQLNTELLSGEGPDILVLDNLPMESYISKGVLLDIRDVIEPMVNNGELLSNVAEAYKQEGGSYYTYPANIVLPFMACQKNALSSAETLEGIAEYARQYKSKDAFISRKWEELMQIFLPIYSQELIMDKEIDEEKIEKFLTTLYDVYYAGDCGKHADEEEVSYYQTTSLIEGKQMAYAKGEGFYSLCLPIGMSEYVKGDIQVINHTFIPASCLSVNKNSKEKELAKEFIRCVLSEKLQDSEMQTGFSTNIKSLESRKNNTKKQKDLQWKLPLQDNKGNTVEVPYGWPTDGRIDQLIDLCKSVTNKGSSNTYITDVFVSCSQDFADGKISAEEAADRIVEKLKIYLKE